MTAVSYHDTVNDLQGLAWSADGPFARLDWFRLLEESGHKPFVALAKAGENAFYLPLEKSAEGITPLTNWYAFTWSGQSNMSAVDDRMLDALAGSLANEASRIEFTKLSEDDCQRYATAFRKAGWLVLRSPCDTNHILRLKGRDFAQYLADRPGRLRTTLKRKAKKVDVTLATSFSAQDWSAYEEIYADSWKPEEGDSALLRRFAESESAAGRYRFGLARLGGEAVAAQFWTVDGDTAYIHKLAHRESAKSVSPGTTVTAALFERVIDTDGVKMVDFGTGDDPYKRDWMEEIRPRWQLTCLRPGAPRNWPAMGKALIRKLVSRNRSG